MQANFDKKAFDVSFDQAIETLTQSEKVTKSVLRELSRSAIEIHFLTEDIGYINRVINSLTPINKKVAIAYFKAFSGFKFIQEANCFGKKNQKQFEKVKEQALEFLIDPHNNIWTWAEVNIEIDVEEKPYDIKVISKYLGNAIKKAEKSGFSTIDVINQILISDIDLSLLLSEMSKADSKAKVDTGLQEMFQAELDAIDSEAAPH